VKEREEKGWKGKGRRDIDKGQHDGKA